MRTGRGFERLVNFSDAVIAIALTLLVLPLVEIPGELEGDENVGSVLAEHSGEILGFLISFLVIWIFWTVHHRTLENFQGYDDVLLWLHMLWLLSIVSLPFMTQFLNLSYDEGGVPIYVATLLVSAIAIFLISLRGRRHTELLHADRDEVQQWLANPHSLYTICALLIALALSIFVPEVGAWPLLLLFLENPVEALIDRIEVAAAAPMPSGARPSRTARPRRYSRISTRSPGGSRSAAASARSMVPPC